MNMAHYPSLQIKRVYEPSQNTDGFRVLIDRLWPRGVKKETAGIDLWVKEVAPSAELRKWFQHMPARWTEFSKRYTLELKNSEKIDSLIKSLRQYDRVTLLYGARDEIHNNAQVLLKFLNDKLKH